MKSLNEFVALFAEQFDETDPGEITAATAYHDLEEWSSLIVLSVIAMVTVEFGVVLKAENIRKAVTIEDLYNYIVSIA